MECYRISGLSYIFKSLLINIKKSVKCKKGGKNVTALLETKHKLNYYEEGK